MTISTIFTLVRAYPIKTIELFFNSFEEMLARDDGVRAFINFSAGVRVNINVGCFGFRDGQAVTVLTTFSFFTHTSLEHRTENSLLIDFVSLLIDFLDNCETSKKRVKQSLFRSFCFLLLLLSKFSLLLSSHSSL